MVAFKGGADSRRGLGRVSDTTPNSPVQLTVNRIGEGITRSTRKLLSKTNNLITYMNTLFSASDTSTRHPRQQLPLVPTSIPSFASLGKHFETFSATVQLGRSTSDSLQTATLETHALEAHEVVVELHFLHGRTVFPSSPFRILTSNRHPTDRHHLVVVPPRVVSKARARAKQKRFQFWQI